jgi:hypothetical protein
VKCSRASELSLAMHLLCPGQMEPLASTVGFAALLVLSRAGCGKRPITARWGVRRRNVFACLPALNEPRPHGSGGPMASFVTLLGLSRVLIASILQLANLDVRSNRTDPTW